MDRADVPPSDSLPVVAGCQPSPGPSGGVASRHGRAGLRGDVRGAASDVVEWSRWRSDGGVARLVAIPLAASRLSDAHSAGVNRMGNGVVVDPTQPVRGVDRAQCGVAGDAERRLHGQSTLRV